MNDITSSANATLLHPRYEDTLNESTFFERTPSNFTEDICELFSELKIHDSTKNNVNKSNKSQSKFEQSNTIDWKKSEKIINFVHEESKIIFQKKVFNFYNFHIKINIQSLNISKDDLLTKFHINSRDQNKRLFNNILMSNFKVQAFIESDELVFYSGIWSSESQAIIKDNLLKITSNIITCLRALYDSSLKKNLCNPYESIIAEGIKKMGFKAIKTWKEMNGMTHLYVITDNGNNCTEEWGTFPILLRTSENIIHLSIIFYVNSNPGIFSDDKFVQVFDFISQTNKQLTDYSFQYNKDTKHISLKKRLTLSDPPENNFKLPQKLTSEAFHIYTSFGYGLYLIYISKKILYENELIQGNAILLEKCLKRYSMPILKFSLPFDDILKNPYYRDYINEDLKKERNIMKIIKENKHLANIFLIEKISWIVHETQGIEIPYKNIRYKGIWYPKILYKERIIQLIETEISMHDRNILLSILGIINSLSESDLMIPRKSFFEFFMVYDNKVYYNFKQPLYKILVKDINKLHYTEMKRFLENIISA